MHKRDFHLIRKAIQMLANEETTVKDLLQDLIDINESKAVYEEEPGKERKLATIKEVKDLNLEDLYQLADLLGMSELYLKKRRERYEHVD